MSERNPSSSGEGQPEIRDDGLPPLAPDDREQELQGKIDDIVPTHGYSTVPVVGIGGSAGAIPALQKFFQAMPGESGNAFVVVMHLAPDFKSTLAEILARWTSMKVLQPGDGETIETNTVYVIPPGKFISAADGKLRLTPLEPERGRRIAVDLFFRTLADTHGANAAAIILSGADGDGALGIKRIKERGGLTVAQDPEEAEHPSMPRTAIGTGMVDWVLPVAEMPARLVEYRANARKVHLPSEEGPRGAKLAPTDSDVNEHALRDVLAHLRSRTGRDFTYYKRATVLRRIARRMQVNGVATLPEYLHYIRTHAGEVGALQQDLLISVTNFFRDRDAFEALEAEIPALFAGKSEGHSVRVWVAGCATGEEAYSIAMLLLEHADRMDSPPAIQVFATDLAEEVIAAAREALFPLTITADVSEERLRRFFSKEHRGYRIRSDLRESVLFAVHDLLKDAPFSRMDLFSCRNLLIYLNNDAQTRALEIAHFALRPEGRLFIGSSETVEDESPLWTPLNKKHRIYKQRPAARVGVPVPIGPGTLTRALAAQERASGGPVLHGSAFASAIAAAARRDAGEHEGRPVSWEELHYKLIERFAPPSLIVTRDHDIVHMSENAGRFLHFSGGEPSVNLLKVVHPMLRIELRAALFRAAQSNTIAEVFRVPLELDGRTLSIDIRVAPAEEIAPDYLLVVFEVREPADPGAIQERREAEPAVRHMEREIEQLKTRLRDNIEQYEASTEELKASNEELQAMNEELRSSAEELETSREELQSVNEEISTVNQELKNKVDELSRANADLNNLMAATGVATIFLDRRLAITRYTPSAVALFRLIPGDLGRPLTDLTHRLNYPDLKDDAENVIESLIPKKREVSDGERWFLAQLLPYRTADDHIGGVVLTFVDVTESRTAARALHSSEERLRLILESATDYAIFTTDLERRVTTWNSGATAILGYTEEEIRGQSGDILFVPEDREAGAPQGEAEKALTQGRAENERWHLRKDGVRIYGSGLSMPLCDGSGAVAGFVKIMRDLTEERRAQEALRAAEERLRIATEAANLYAWDSDIETQRISFASTTEPVLGFALPESAHAAAALIHPDDRALVSERYEVALRERGRFDVEFRFVHPETGESVWQSSHGVFVQRPDGRAGFVGITQNITVRKRTEEALKCSEEQFRRAIEDAPIPVIMHAEDGEVLQISHAWTELTGYTRKEMPTLDAWLPRAYGEAAGRMRSQINRIFAGDARLIDAEIEVTTRDGAARLWSFSASAPGTLRDGRRFIVGMALDITERKRAEQALQESQERLRLVVENAREYAIFSMDRERRITSWNSGAEAILGFTEDEAVGQSADIIFTPEDREAGAPDEESGKALTEGRAADERWHVRKDGTRFWGSGVMTAMHNDAGEVVGFVKIFRDQTAELVAKAALEKSRAELWEAAQENELARREAEAANQAKDNFLAILSHELRTPLTPVTMAAGALLRRTDLPPDVVEAVEMIRRNVQLEGRFIDELLDVTRIARGKLELVLEPMDLHQAIEHAVEVCAADLEAKNQKLIVSMDASEHRVHGDFTRLQQVFWNLLKNAAKFTPVGGEIRLATSNAPGWIVVQITDTGMGIAPEVLPRIFDPFYQGDESVTRQFGGLGLGLALAKATVDGHRGVIRAESHGEAEGAAFIVELPLNGDE